MPRKTPPCEHYPKWTEARYRAFIRSALRKAWAKWPPKFEVKLASRREVEGQRHRYEYQCASCLNWFKEKETRTVKGKKKSVWLIQVDHIEPVGSESDGWDALIKRLFVGTDKLQMLCTDCHNIKTQQERLDRK